MVIIIAKHNSSFYMRSQPVTIQTLFLFFKNIYLLIGTYCVIVSSLFTFLTNKFGLIIFYFQLFNKTVSHTIYQCLLIRLDLIATVVSQERFATVVDNIVFSRFQYPGLGKYEFINKLEIIEKLKESNLQQLEIINLEKHEYFAS